MRRDRHDRGSVTAELAVALPALVLLLGVALTAVAALTAQLRCVDAAREAARAAARGEPVERVREAGLRVAPGGARLDVDGDGETVVVAVRAQVRALGVALPVLTVSGRAVALREDAEEP